MSSGRESLHRLDSALSFSAPSCSLTRLVYVWEDGSSVLAGSGPTEPRVPVTAVRKRKARSWKVLGNTCIA